MRVLIQNGPHEGVHDVPAALETVDLMLVASGPGRDATRHRYRRVRSSDPSADLVAGIHARYQWEP